MMSSDSIVLLFLLREHPVNQSPFAVGASFSPRRHIAPLVYCIYLRSRYLPDAKNSSPSVLRGFSLREKPNGFGLPGALSKEKEELWNLITEWKKVLSVRAGAYGMPLTGFGANIRCVHPTDSESCTAGADHWSPVFPR